MFGPPFSPPVSDGSGQDRALLQRANTLLKEAGCQRQGAQLHLPDGSPFAFEILEFSNAFDKVVDPMFRNMRLLGIEPRLRVVDSAQYKSRIDNFDFDMVTDRKIIGGVPGDELLAYFGSASGKSPGGPQSRGHRGPRRRYADRQGAAGQKPRRTGDRLPGAGPGLARGPLLHTQLVLAQPPHRRLGRVRPSRRRAKARSRHSRPVVVGCGKSRRGEGQILMLAYAARRILLMIPTLFGILALSFLIVQFAPGGPVERVLAQMQGQDSGATARFGGGANTVAAGQAGAASQFSGKYRGAQGLDPKFIAELEKQFGFDKPPLERFWLMIRNYAVFDFGRSYFRDAPVLQLIKEKLPVSMSLGLWMTFLSYAISIPLGIAKARHEGEKFDVWTSAVIIVGYAIPSFLFAILLIVLFAGGSFWQIFPLRGLTSDDFSQFPCSARSRITSGISCCRWRRWPSAPSPPRPSSPGTPSSRKSASNMSSPRG